MMEWSEIIESPYFRDLPFKVETNQHGTIMMTPASNRHNDLQGEIYWQMREQRQDGRPQIEFSIVTDRGVKVPDIAWRSDSFIAQHRGATPCPSAPEVCAEVILPSNTQGEIDSKIGLYFAMGAEEVWLCDADGNMTFRDADGVIERSRLFPDFPARVEIPGTD